ncbi:hypothetical protein V8E36_005309 [Tilletia maclaganii]
MSAERDRRTVSMQLRPQPARSYASNDGDNEDVSEHDRASPTPSSFTSSDLSSAPSPHQPMHSPDDSNGAGPVEAAPDSSSHTDAAQHHVAHQSTSSVGDSSAVAESSTASTSAGPLGAINLAEIFKFSKDPSSRPRGSLTALVHRGQSHPVSRGSPKKKRNKCNSEQLAALEEFFATNRNPTGRIREELSKRIDMPERSVQVWFQNKRAKIKTGDPKPDAEILAEFANNTTASPITQLALAGIAARNKQLQISTPAPPPPPPPQKTAEALPAFSLTVGSWRRLNPTLVIFFALKLQTFVSYVRSESLGYKLDIPIQSVIRLGFTGPDSPTQVEVEEGLEEAIGRFTIEVNRAPTFFMEVFRSTRDGDANNKPSWRQCSDFTQDRQATKETLHQICGPYAELKNALATIVDTSEAVRARMSAEDIARILSPSAPVPMIPFEPAAPPMAYLLPEQPQQQQLSYPSTSMMSLHPAAHTHYNPAGMGVPESTTNDTIMARNSWRFANSAAASGSAPLGPTQGPSSEHQQAMAGIQAGSSQSFEWYGSTSTAHSSGPHAPLGMHTSTYGSGPSSSMQFPVPQCQLTTSIPLSLHGRSAPAASVMQGSASFPHSYPMGPASDSSGMQEAQASSSAHLARGFGSRSGFHSNASSMMRPTSTSSSSASHNSLGGASAIGTPQTCLSNLSGESGGSFTNHFASGFSGIGLDIASMKGTGATSMQHDSRGPSGSAPDPTESTAMLERSGSEARSQPSNAAAQYYGEASQGHGQHASGSGSGSGGFMLPPRISWSESSAGYQPQQQHFGSHSHPLPQGSWGPNLMGSAGAGGPTPGQPVPRSFSLPYASQQSQSQVYNTAASSRDDAMMPPAASNNAWEQNATVTTQTSAPMVNATWQGHFNSPTAQAAGDTQSAVRDLRGDLHASTSSGSVSAELPRESKGSGASSIATAMPRHGAHGAAEHETDHQGQADADFAGYPDASDSGAQAQQADDDQDADAEADGDGEDGDDADGDADADGGSDDDGSECQETA